MCSHYMHYYIEAFVNPIESNDVRAIFSRQILQKHGFCLVVYGIAKQSLADFANLIR